MAGMEALQVVRFGGLGNQFSTIINALILCRIFGVQNLILRDSVLFNRSFVTTNGVNVFQYGEKHFNKTHVSIFWSWSGYHHCPSQWMLEAAHSIRDAFISQFSRPNITSKTLVLHMRSNEIFGPVATPGRGIYGQPCCQYYVDAMNIDRGHDSVLLVTQDRANPCVKVCEDHGASFHPINFVDFPSRLRLLLWTERLVLSRSTLMKAVVYLSPVRKTLYAFGGLNIKDAGCGMTWYFLQPMGAHWHCTPSRDYQLNVILSWNLDKIGRLLNETCQWEYLPYIRSSDYINI
jgi:hypothetical protein